MKNSYQYQSLGETLEHARSLGFDDSDDSDMDELESDAVAFIRSKGIEVTGYDDDEV